MRLKFTILASIIFVNAAFSQTHPAPPFTHYAEKIGDEMHAAYEKRDTAQDRQLVENFVSGYNKLNTDDKAWFRGNIINAYYNLSCVYALTNDKQNAFKYLDSAISKGYLNYAHLREDSDFDGIRQDASFKALTNNIRSLGDYLYILQKGGKYDETQRRPVPKITYQPATAPELVAIRKKFKLDSIAGNGPDSAKMINILRWVHNTVGHDGQHESGIRSINADEIITVAKAKNTGVSCGELATVLQDCYLAMGWKARKVYCFPKDSLKTDFDSHVINVVYLPAKQKWVWMDPTNNAYVTNDHGELLSIEEVRERLVNGKPLNINPDANWNNRAPVVKQNYLYNYMAKNLYMLYSPLKSEYDYQSPDKNKKVSYVLLLPVDYYKQTPATTEESAADGKRIVTRYRTNNQKQFWSAPDVTIE